MKYKMDAEGNYSESGTATDIFTLKDVANNELDVNVTWTKQADGTFTYTLDEAALKDQIKLSQTFKLDLKSEHDAFRAAMNGNIVARVTDGIIS